MTLAPPSSTRPAEGPRTLGTFRGVYRPTVLTIIGLILYLREGWVVGQAGLLGALGVIGLTFVITGATALSLSSITTNTRIGAGGAFSLVSQSLGLEAGGAIGVPLFFAQALSIGFYMRGVAEAWLHLFPHHPTHLVLGTVYALGFAASLLSERLVLRFQLVVMLAVIAALVSMWAGVFRFPLRAPVWIGGFEDAGFWQAFAIFFPAGTGIMVGPSLSGKLRDPRRDIPRGLMLAWSTALVAYLVAAVFYAVVATPEELRSLHLIGMERAAFPPGVLLGLVASCVSAMLGSMLAAPNVLVALAEQRLVPFHARLARMTESGTPRAALMVSAVIVGAELLLADLDAIANLITVFFLLTYATINLVVVVEQALKMISFRPTLRVPLAIPVFGAVSSTLLMIQTEPMPGLAALGAVVALYAYYSRQNVETPWETVRSGLVVALAHRVAEMVQSIEGPQYRAWKPDLLVPVFEPGELTRQYRLLSALAAQRGSVQVVAVRPKADPTLERSRMAETVERLRQREIVATLAEVETENAARAVATAATILRHGLLSPNVLVVNAPERSAAELTSLDEVSRHEGMGLVLVMGHAEALPASTDRVHVHVWLRFQESPDWHEAISRCNVDLMLLLGYQLQQSLHGRLQLHTVAPPGLAEKGRQFLRKIAREARLGGDTTTDVVEGSFPDALTRGRSTDVHLLGLPNRIDPPSLRDASLRLGATCLFVRDSGRESAFA